ncbi:MAG: hypothetical protein IT365_03280 [Candidatus Hydrogenedentes bacterium]|nr:hypothetical protein [Candidatus Hydrogenedentota bacterium]
MSTLIENILSLEQEASAMVAKAHEEALALAQQAEEQIQAHRAAVAEETGRRIEAYRSQTQVRHEEEVVEANERYAKAAESIEQVPQAALRKQIELIANTFRGL